MKSPQLKLLLDKYAAAVPDTPDTKGKTHLRNQIRADMKAFADEVLQFALKEISVYGVNTHSYATLWGFLVEFRRDV